MNESKALILYIYIYCFEVIFMKVKVIMQPPTKEKLKIIYDVCNKIFRDNEEVFYTKEQVKELKKDKSNIFL